MVDDDVLRPRRVISKRIVRCSLRPQSAERLGQIARAGQIDLVIDALRHHIAVIGSLDIRALPAERRLCSRLEAWSRTCRNLWFSRHFSASLAYDRQALPALGAGTGQDLPSLQLRIYGFNLRPLRAHRRRHGDRAEHATEDCELGGSLAPLGAALPQGAGPIERSSMSLSDQPVSPVRGGE